MEWIDILQKIASGEDERTELKRTFEKDRVGEALCAFANSEGGLVILGVDDAQNLVGLGTSEPGADKLTEQLTSYLQTGLSAPVQARLGRHRDPAGWVHWIEVPRQRGFEPMRHGNRVFVRRGRASVQPSAVELQELYNVFGYVLTEERAIAGTSTSDLDEQVFRDFLRAQGIDLDEEPRLPIVRDLVVRGAMAELGGETLATLYGYLAFGRRPQGAPQTTSFWVECVAYAGLDRAADPLQVAECKGRLDEQVERALGWLRGLRRREVYDDSRRSDQHLVPEIAAREAVVNAVAHRDYAILGSRVLVEVFDDRVTITSPGTLPNHMTPESVTRGAHPRSRNELIATYFLTMGRMEGRGRGWPRIRKAMREAGAGEPQLEEERAGAYVRVTLPFERA